MVDAAELQRIAATCQPSDGLIEFGCGDGKTMAKGLNILTHAANGPSTTDRRKYPTCEKCSRKVEAMGNGAFLKHCWKHFTLEEWQQYKASYDTPPAAVLGEGE